MVWILMREPMAQVETRLAEFQFPIFDLFYAIRLSGRGTVDHICKARNNSPTSTGRPRQAYF